MLKAPLAEHFSISELKSIQVEECLRLSDFCPPVPLSASHEATELSFL